MSKGKKCKCHSCSCVAASTKKAKQPSDYFTLEEYEIGLDDPDTEEKEESYNPKGYEKSFVIDDEDFEEKEEEEEEEEEVDQDCAKRFGDPKIQSSNSEYAFNERVYYSHFELPLKTRTSSSFKKGHATVAFTLDREARKVFYAVAYCSPVDKFIKKVGREIACEKLYDDYEHKMVSNYGVGSSLYKLSLMLLQLDLTSDSAPKWAKKVVLEWL